MRPRFERIGLDFRFNPTEVPASLYFYRVKDGEREFTARVDVVNGEGKRFVTRTINLLTTRGLTKDLVDELNQKFRYVGWADLMREASQSVIASVQAGRPLEVIQGEIVRPPPPAWLCQGLLLKDKPNVWLGAASTGKSTLAKAICAYYASGYRFCEREMEQGVPLYLDWEDDRADFERVVYDVCRNLGVWPLPKMLWRDMHGYRLRDQIATLSQMIDHHGVGLLVMDAIAAAGGSPNEHSGYEAIALELESCLGVLPPVTVLGLDHVTSAEHKLKGYVPLKARGAERKVEFFRNQWSLVTDDEAETVGRHVVNWHHTKVNVVAKEQPFATEIVHRPDEVSIIVRPMQTQSDAADRDETSALLASLGNTWRTPRDLALQFDGKEPSRGRVESVRTLLERAVKRDRAVKDDGRPVRYSCRQPGEVIRFPGTA